jgi:methyl-accepting chemotaxis protein
MLLIGAVILASQAALMYMFYVTGVRNIEAYQNVDLHQSKLQTVQEIRIDTLELLLAAKNAIIEKGEGKVAEKRKKLFENKAAYIRGNLKLTGEMAETAEEKSAGQELLRESQSLFSIINTELIRAVDSGASAEDLDKLSGQIQERGEAFLSRLELIEETVRIALKESGDNNGDVSKAAMKRGFMVFAAAVIFLLLAFSMFSRELLSNIGRVTAMIRGVAEGEGDLTRRLATGSKDEIGEMAYWFNRFVENLQAMIVHLAGNSQRLSASAGELLTVSNSLASGSEEMTAQAGSVAAATEQMSANIHSMAQSAEQMSSNVSHISGGAVKMSRNMNVVSGAVEEMAASTQEIAGNARAAAQVAERAQAASLDASATMAELGIAANEIGKVTEVIKKIAEQTNLLALNATIEAASAGAAGRGFAVVAHEIKQLAHQSASAAEDIATRIDGAQKNTKNAVKAIAGVASIIGEINQSVECINQAVFRQTSAAANISSNVGEATSGANDIAASIAIVAKGAQNVAKSAGHAAAGANDVSANIHGVNKATNDQSAGAQQVNGSAQQLAQIATALDAVIRRFKVA